MFKKLTDTYHSYDRQFWVLFFGMLVSTVGTSMIWPFQVVYASDTLHLPLTNIMLLLSISSFSGLVSAVIFSPLIDRLGRKKMMIVGLLAHAASLLFLSQAQTYTQFALLMALNGIANPIYRIGADAMTADLVPPEKRVNGYALLRLSHNLGISIGPTIGGLLATQSYTPIFWGGAVGLTLYSLLMGFMARETVHLSRLARPEPAVGEKPAAAPDERFGGFLRMSKDSAFMRFLFSFTLVQFSAIMIWQLMPIYAMQTYGIPKAQYGLLPTTNAAMVVLLQVLVTAVTRNYNPLPVVALGSFFYAAAVGGVALSQTFLGFWSVMVFMTIGELIIMPTSSTYIANLAPADMRGRYMGLYGFSWSLAGMVAPVLGGYLSDNLNPRAPWLVGAGIGLLATLTFLYSAWLARRKTST